MTTRTQEIRPPAHRRFQALLPGASAATHRIIAPAVLQAVDR